MAEGTDEKWAGWPEKKKTENEEKTSTEPESGDNERLLLSERVQSFFTKMDAAQRRNTLPNKSVVTRDGHLDLEERAYLGMLLSDVAGFKDKSSAEKDISHAMCCAEFYAELFPAKLHGRLTEAEMEERLTLAIRRSSLACKARTDPRLANCLHKIPLNPTENPIEADPFSIHEIFWLLVAVAEKEDAKKQIIQIRRRNLIILTISICKRGYLTNANIPDKIKQIKEEYKLPDLEITSESIEQLWKIYGKHVALPPANIPMLVNSTSTSTNSGTDEKVSKGKKQDETNKEEAAGVGKEGEEKKPGSTKNTEDEEVAQLTDLMEDIKLDTSKDSWSLFFDRLERKCEKSRHLQFFVKKLLTTGNMTVTSQFRKAYKKFPDFDWIMAFAEFPGEQARLWRTLEELDKDPYCTYRKPHLVNHLKDFLHLGYLGIKLQEKAGGIASLSGYKGLTKYHSKMPKRHLVDHWVASYCGTGSTNTVNINRPDPTLKYANFQIPNGKGRGDETYKYVNVQLPQGKGTHDRYGTGYGYRGYDEGYYGEQAGYEQEYYQQDQGYHGDQGYHYDNQGYYGNRGGDGGQKTWGGGGSGAYGGQYQGGYGSGPYGDAGTDPYGPWRPTYRTGSDYNSGERFAEDYRGLRDDFTTDRGREVPGLTARGSDRGQYRGGYGSGPYGDAGSGPYGPWTRTDGTGSNYNR